MRACLRQFDNMPSRDAAQVRSLFRILDKDIKICHYGEICPCKVFAVNLQSTSPCVHLIDY